MQAIRQAGQSVSLFTGATVNGVQTEAEVLMQRHTPTDWLTADKALDAWQQLCAQLKAVDKTMPLKALTMNPHTGGLFNREKREAGKPMPGGVIPTRTALQHLTSFIGEDKPDSGIVDNLEWYKPELRAQMLAQLMERTAERSIVMRTAVSPQDNALVVRAMTSELHSQENGDDLAIITQLRKLSSLSTARMRVVKQWDNTHIELVFPNKVREVRKGITINTRINITNSETKGGSFEASVGTMNLVCINGMVGNGNKSTITVKHMGDIRTRIHAGVITVVDLADVYLQEYADAYSAALPVTRAEAIERTVKRFQLPSKTAGAQLAALWDIDGERGGGDTVAGLANAMTRLAQQLPVEKALELERAAGVVVSDGREAFL